MEIKIVATTGRASGQSVAIKAAKFFIGHHENCQLRPDIPGLAGIHALIEQRYVNTFLRDFGGEGGTGINDRVLHARETEIFDGDLIQIGPMVLSISIKSKGEPVPSLAHAPDGWPFLEGSVDELTAESPAQHPAQKLAPHITVARPEPEPVERKAAVAVATQPEKPPVQPLRLAPIVPRPILGRALSCRTIDDVLVATILHSDLNEESSVSPVRYELRSILEEEHTPTRMVIDLGNTRYLSSRAVGVILAHYQGLERKGSSMRVCGVSREIQPVLDQMRLSMLIDVYPTVEEAVQTSWE